MKICETYDLGYLSRFLECFQCSKLLKHRNLLENIALCWDTQVRFFE